MLSKQLLENENPLQVSDEWNRRQTQQTSYFPTTRQKSGKAPKEATSLISILFRQRWEERRGCSS